MSEMIGKEKQSFLILYISAIVVLLLISISFLHSSETAILPEKSPTETVEITGPYTKLEIVSGFNTTRGNHVSFVSKKAIVILRVRQISNSSETYILFLACIPYEEFKKLLEQDMLWPYDARLEERLIIEGLVKAIREHDITLLKEFTDKLESKFKEFKAYVKYTETPIYLFTLEPGEEIEIPIILEAPTGKVSKTYLLGAFLITPFAPAEGYSVGGAGGLYIGP